MTLISRNNKRTLIKRVLCYNDIDKNMKIPGMRGAGQEHKLYISIVNDLFSQLKDLDIHDYEVDELVENLRRIYFSSWCPGNFTAGLLAMESQAQPIVQGNLKSFHMSGAGRNRSSGISSIKSLYRVTKNRETDTFVFFKNKYLTPRDIYDYKKIIKYRILEDFLYKHMIISEKDFKEICELNIDKKYSLKNYCEIFNINEPKKYDFMLILMFDNIKLMRYNISIFKIIKKIMKGELRECMTLIPSDVFILDERNIISLYCFPNKEKLLEIKDNNTNMIENISRKFLQEIIIPSFTKIYISGIKNFKKFYVDSIKLTKYITNAKKTNIILIKSKTEIDNLMISFFLPILKIYEKNEIIYILSDMTQEDVDHNKKKFTNCEIEQKEGFKLSFNWQEAYWDRIPEERITQMFKSKYGNNTEIYMNMSEPFLYLIIEDPTVTDPIKDISAYISKEEDDEQQAISEMKYINKKDLNNYRYSYAILGGKNYKELTYIDDIDCDYTYSTDPHEMNEIFGIEATKVLLGNLFNDSIKTLGSTIDFRHIVLTISMITNTGQLVPTGSGEIRTNAPLEKGAISNAYKHLKKGAEISSSESTKTVFGSIFTGQGSGTGTAKVKLYTSSNLQKEKESQSSYFIKELEKPIPIFEKIEIPIKLRYPPKISKISHLEIPKFIKEITKMIDKISGGDIICRDIINYDISFDFIEKKNDNYRKELEQIDEFVFRK